MRIAVWKTYDNLIHHSSVMRPSKSLANPIQVFIDINELPVQSDEQFIFLTEMLDANISGRMGESLYIYILFVFLHQFYNSDDVQKKQIIQFVNKKYYTNWYLGKKFNKKRRLITFILLEQNQPAL